MKTCSSKRLRSKKKWTTSLRLDQWSKGSRMTEMHQSNNLGKSWLRVHSSKADVVTEKLHESSLVTCSRSAETMDLYFWRHQNMKNAKMRFNEPWISARTDWSIILSIVHYGSSISDYRKRRDMSKLSVSEKSTQTSARSSNGRSISSSRRPMRGLVLSKRQTNISRELSWNAPTM